MKKQLMIAVLLGTFVISAGAEEFYLKHDKSGKLFGPFDSAAGSKVVISKAKFTVVKKGKSALGKKLNAMEIPHIELRSAALEDAIDYLKMQTEALDPEDTGVNFVIVKPKPPKKKSSDGFGGFDHDFGSTPRVTLSLKKVSALQVLKSLMEQTGATYKTSGNTVTIYLKK